MNLTGTSRVEVNEAMLADLEAKARAATAGPWHACIGSARRSSWLDLASGSLGGSPDGESCKCRMVHMEHGPPVIYALAAEDESFTCGEGATKDTARANARFVGAANPLCVLALVERIRELESEVEDWKGAYRSAVNSLENVGKPSPGLFGGQ